MTNLNLPFPFPDAVAEFSVETSAMGAQSGLHPGGLVNVVTRSGSNQWHGSAFEFIRNNYIDATNFFSTSKDTLHQNQFGGTFGGRIIRDKLFAFAGYQRLKNAQAQSLTTAYVPTAANLLGDFSASDPTIQLVPGNRHKTDQQQVFRYTRRYLEFQRQCARPGQIPSAYDRGERPCHLSARGASS
jgi:hypothetical protein